MFFAKIYVTLKPSVSDPEGQAILRALHSLNFQEVSNVRAGKYFEVWLDLESEQEARKKVQALCERLLANPVIESYGFSLERSLTSQGNFSTK